MSVVVWDGKTLAADCMAVNFGLKMKISKIKKLPESGVIYHCVPPSSLVAWTGQQDQALELLHWYELGQDREKYPSFQSTENWTRFIVIKRGGKTIKHFVFEQTPFPIVGDDKMAWGSGRDYALGAMELGADAVKAVEVASKFSDSCGFGVEAFEL